MLPIKTKDGADGTCSLQWRKEIQLQAMIKILKTYLLKLDIVLHVAN